MRALGFMGLFASALIALAINSLSERMDETLDIVKRYDSDVKQMLEEHHRWQTSNQPARTDPIDSCMSASWFETYKSAPLPQGFAGCAANTSGTSSPPAKRSPKRHGVTHLVTKAP